jgi:hypothetical protein
MKKIFPYIFILLIVTSFLAPFGLGVSQSGVTVNRNIASASCDKDNVPEGCDAALYKTFTSEEKKIYDGLTSEQRKNVNEDLRATSEVSLSAMTIFQSRGYITGGYAASNAKQLTPEQQSAYNNLTQAQQLVYEQSLKKSNDIDAALGAAKLSAKSNINPDPIPTCGITSGANGFIGCFVWVILYPVFKITSWIFNFSGVFFDWAFNYSVQDNSYRSPFVVQGWGVVRDFVNIFFIFVLLYIAISTMLDVHGVDTKQMIINVVIIGLLINFSLFTTQVIIDTSNIIARVFYNADSIKLKKPDGTIINNENGRIDLSAAIVNKVNPQELIINGVNKVDINIGNTGSIGGGTFMLITILAIAINLVGTIVFLSTGLVFIGRVIGLWLACIFVPFAFFSYTVPSMSGLELVGWKHWWPDTIKQAFLAPVFIFFLYLILKFMETGLSLFPTDKTTTGMTYFIGVLIPFVFIMMLLWKAKDIAKGMSGTMGQAITGAVAAAGGLALGGGAAGLAFAGRQGLGRLAAKASRQASQEKDAHQAGIASGAIPVGTPLAYSNFGALGAKINKRKEKVDEIDHGNLELEKAKKAAHLDGVDNSQLGGPEIERVKKEYIKAEEAKVKAKIKEHGETGQILNENDYKSLNRAAVARRLGNPTSDAGKKQIEEMLTSNYNKELKTAVDTVLGNSFSYVIDATKGKVNLLDRAVARSNTSSYDIRKVTGGNNKNGGVLNGIGAGGIAAIALAVRTGMKAGMGVNAGKATGDIRTDLADIMSSALKGIKIEVPKGGGGHDDHGGGHDDHGGGGHH